MKKITFVMFALLAGTTFAQDATAEASAAADIVSPIEITAEQDLNFGKVSNNTAGSVVVDTDGAATGLSQIGSTAPKAATFDVIAANGFSYTITLPSSIELLSGTDKITVDTFNHNATSTSGTGVAQTIGVGATLKVASAQATGNYTGKFDVTVSYE